MNKEEEIKRRVIEYQNRQGNIQEILRVAKGVPICLLLNESSVKSIKKMNTVIRELVNTDDTVEATNNLGVKISVLPEALNTDVEKWNFLTTSIKVVE